MKKTNTLNLQTMPTFKYEQFEDIVHVDGRSTTLNQLEDLKIKNLKKNAEKQCLNICQADKQYFLNFSYLKFGIT